MPLSRSFKTDESFLEKIAIGAIGTRRVFDDLIAQGHNPIELERGSTSFKIWKTIKIKRVRVPDILCVCCGKRIEARAKTKLQITMSHSTSTPERGWDFGLDDEDMVAFVHCQHTGSGPLDWTANDLIQYVKVKSLRETWLNNHVKIERPKGSQEGFETRVTWPSAVTTTAGIIEQVDTNSIQYRKSDSTRRTTLRLNRQQGKLIPLVEQGFHVQPHQIVASIVPVTPCFPCEGIRPVQHYLALANSSSLSDRYTAVKALGRFTLEESGTVLTQRMQDTREHIYVRLESAANLMRYHNTLGYEFLATTLYDEYLENRLEATIVLGEVATPQSLQLLIKTLQDSEQHPEIRAGAAWSLGEIGKQEALSTLIQSFNSLEMIIKIEAARALAKIGRIHLDKLLEMFPESTLEQRPGIAWALGKAGGFSVDQIIPSLIDEDSRHWIAYIIGMQPQDAMLPDIEQLALHDPHVYFAVTVLWKILSSWVYNLEEY